MSSVPNKTSNAVSGFHAPPARPWDRKTAARTGRCFSQIARSQTACLICLFRVFSKLGRGNFFNFLEGLRKNAVILKANKLRSLHHGLFRGSRQRFGAFHAQIGKIMGANFVFENPTHRIGAEMKYAGTLFEADLLIEMLLKVLRYSKK